VITVKSTKQIVAGVQMTRMWWVLFYSWFSSPPWLNPFSVKQNQYTVYTLAQKIEILKCSSLHKIVDDCQIAKMHILLSFFHEHLTTKVLEH
jgi:hypothetical protein